MKSKYMVIILATFLIFGINATFASEHGNETLMMHESALELSVEETPTEILSENQGSYLDLKKDIDSTPAGGELKLQNNYKFNSTRDTPSAGIYTCVAITKSITIDGQNNIIDGGGCQRGIFDITGKNIVLKNIIFKNGYTTGNGGCIYAHSTDNFQLINCTFRDSSARTHGGAIDMSSAHNTSIVSCNFINNSATSNVPRGGAINWVSSTGGTITGCKFIKNSAEYGGAIRMEGVNGVHQYNNDFRDNTATNYGGDIMCDDAKANFHDCNFTNSYAKYGGSIYWKGSDTVLYNLKFNNVTSTSRGGAIYFANCQNATVKSSSFKKYKAVYGGAISFATGGCSVVGCDFEDGSATYGGAIYAGKNIKIADSTFKNNTVSGSGASGGAISIDGENTIVDDCKFESSSSPGNGGTIMIYVSGKGSNITNCEFKSGNAKNMGGAVYSNAVNVLISDNEFIQNVANLGGALYSGSADFRAVNNTFTANNATQHGGAVYSVGAGAILEDNIYTANYAGYNGGAVFLRGNTVLVNKERFTDNVANNGGALALDSADAQVNNSYFRGNNATYGSAIFKGGAVAYINNADFVYNQAHADSIKVARSANSFRVTFRGFDNILNAIWNNADASTIFIDGANPKSGARESNDGELVYQDSREFNQTITATVLDRKDNVINVLTQRTDYLGETLFEINEGYKVIFSHPNDVFYTGAEAVDYISGIKVEKIALTPVVVNGTQARFQIAITNTGYYSLAGLRVSEDSFDGLVYDRWEKSDMWTYDGEGWTFNTPLVADEVAILTLHFNTTDVGEFTNTASAKCEGNLTGTANADVKVIPDTFDVKKVSLMPVTKVGDQTIFEIVIQNIGESDIHNVFIIEDSFEGLVYDGTYEDHLWDYETLDDGRHKWTLKGVLPGHEKLGIFVVFNTTEVGNFTNYAIVGHEGATKTVNATVWVNETVHEPENPNPQMSIDIFTVHPVIMVDGEVWFEITVENTGNIVLNNVTVEEFRHDNLVFAGFEIDSPLWDYRPKTLSNPNRVELLSAPVEDNHAWIINTPLLQNEILGFFVKFVPTKTGSHSNTVYGHSAETPELQYATDHVLVLDADYTIQKVVLNSTVSVGDQVTFQIIVHNTGSAAIEGMEIIENPDESLIFDRWYCDGETWGSEGPTHYYLWEPIAPGGYSEFFVVYNATKPGNITNIVLVDGESYNATVEVANRTENETSPDETPIEDEPVEEDSTPESVVIDAESDHFEASSTYSEPVEKIYSAKVDRNATGHPLLALILVLACLVLRRRR